LFSYPATSTATNNRKAFSLNSKVWQDKIFFVASFDPTSTANSNIIIHIIINNNNNSHS